MLVELNKFMEIGGILMFFLLDEGSDGVVDEQSLPLFFEEFFALGILFLLLLVLRGSLVGVEGNLVLLLVVFDEVGERVILGL